MSKVAARLKSVKTGAPGKIGGRYACYIPAGKAAGGPPLGTELGKLGVNIPAFVKDFNDKTKHFKEGIPIGCEVDVNRDRSYQMMLSSPPMSYYLFQAAGITKGSSNTWTEVSGWITLKHCYEIAKIKQNDFYKSHIELEELTKRVIYFAQRMGLKIFKDPIDPKEYELFLVERKKYVEEQEAAYKEAMESKLLRLNTNPS